MEEYSPRHGSNSVVGAESVYPQWIKRAAGNDPELERLLLEQGELYTTGNSRNPEHRQAMETVVGKIRDRQAELDIDPMVWPAYPKTQGQGIE